MCWSYLCLCNYSKKKGGGEIVNQTFVGSMHWLKRFMWENNENLLVWSQLIAVWNKMNWNCIYWDSSVENCKTIRMLIWEWCHIPLSICSSLLLPNFRIDTNPIRQGRMTMQISLFTTTGSVNLNLTGAELELILHSSPRKGIRVI